MSTDALGMLSDILARGTRLRRRHEVRSVTSLVAGDRSLTANRRVGARHVTLGDHVTTVRWLAGGVYWWNSRAAVVSYGLTGVCHGG